MSAAGSIEASGERFVLREGAVEDEHAAFAANVREGLLASPKRLSCRFLYDATGSELFQRITRLSEYYPTRAEAEILAARADEIAASLAPPVDLVELGSGSGEKTEHLIAALLRGQERLVYRPIDVSESALVASAERLLATFPRLEVRAERAGYQAGLARLDPPSSGSRLVCWLGSSIGNLTDDQAAAFLGELAGTMRKVDRLLLGADLWKDPEVLRAAYDDAAGVTARFTKNLLVRANRELGARFDTERFAHIAEVDPEGRRVRLFLESLADQEVPIEALDLVVRLRRGERIHVEDSHKYTPESLATILARAGLAPLATWTDRAGRFADLLARRA